MSDDTRRTVRTVLQATIAILRWLAAYLPPLLDELGITRDSWAGVGMLLGILAAVTRLSQTGILDRALTAVGAGKTGRHEAA